MDPEAIALFREVADLSPSEREEYFARHHVAHAVRSEVESLLNFDSGSKDSISDCVAAVADNISRSHEPDSTPSSDTGEGRFPAGTLLAGRYRVINLLGHGGMGEVYRAADLKLNQAVALKLLPERSKRDEHLLSRLYGEVRLARQISHPNVCRVYDIGESDGIVYISMEYIDGEDLASLLRRIGRLPYDKALEIARFLCAGLAAAHDKGIVHRDLKPATHPSRAILGRQWMAAIVFILLASAPSLISSRPWIDFPFALPVSAVSLWTLVRFGVLPAIVANFVSSILRTFPITTDFSAWYAGATLFVLTTVVLLALLSFRFALAGRPVVQDEFLAATD